MGFTNCWTGLDWTGLEWIVLDWIGMDWTGVLKFAFVLRGVQLKSNHFRV